MKQFMQRVLLATLAAATLRAAAIRGMVVESQSGYPLARATVMLETVQSAPDPRTVRTNLSGIFEFTGLPSGAYRISAAKAGFAPVQYGQKRWFSPGMPIPLSADDTADLTIRMPRFGGISGAVFDENDVGLPDHEIGVYTNTRPPRLLAHAPTDDRGAYRLGGLRPGKYLIRSLAKSYDDESYLPTFYRDSALVDEAHAIEVKLDEEVEHMDFHPAPGRLFTVSGRVNIAAGVPVVTLSSDTGVEMATIDGGGNFTFKPMAPGQYELLAVFTSDRPQNRLAAFQTITVERDIGGLYLNPSNLPAMQFAFVDTTGRPLAMPAGSVMVRRKDPAAEGNVEVIKTSDAITLLPGRWEVAVKPGTTQCAVEFDPADSTGRADGWNEILLPQGSRTIARFVLSLKPAGIAGTVKNAKGDAVAGVPVFVEPYDLDPRKRIEPMRWVSTDAQGHYGVAGLAAGVYRLLASFDYEMPEPAQMDAANARTVRVDDGGRATLDLEEFVIH